MHALCTCILSNVQFWSSCVDTLFYWFLLIIWTWSENRHGIGTFLDRPAYFRLKEHRFLFPMKFIKDWKSNRRRILEYKWSINFLIVKRKNVNEIKTQVIRMFVCLNNGGTLSIIGVIMKAIDDSKIRSAPLVTGLLQYWVFIIFIWMLDCFSNSDIDRSVFTRRAWSSEPQLNC